MYQIINHTFVQIRIQEIEHNHNFEVFVIGRKPHLYKILQLQFVLLSIQLMHRLLHNYMYEKESYRFYAYKWIKYQRIFKNYTEYSPLEISAVIILKF